MKFSDYDSIYFLGIGGIGMSALARWFRHKNLRVAGYDRTPTPLTHELIEEGMELHFDDKVEFIPGYLSKEKTLVIFTPAIPKDHAEYNYLKDRGFTILKRSEVLGLISKDYRTIGVAGTHGKTTTSSLIAHILKSAGKNMVGFLGGITSNYDSNLVMHGEVNKETIVVAEADEFDRSFLRLFPDMAVVTSADPDHLDIYGDHASMLTSFRDFIKQINENGTLVIHHSVESLAAVNPKISEKTYGLNQGQFFAGNLTAVDGFFKFDLLSSDGGKKIENIELGVPGFHNVENAIAATLIAREAGIDDASIKSALASFKGVKRRFEFIVRQASKVFIDDYAHHPAEIEAFLKSLRAMYAGKKITVVFQPHLYTRTRDFADGFAKSLSLADELVLMDIYPARELPIPGVTSDLIFKNVTSPVKIRSSKKDLLTKLSSLQVEVIATVGAGDIDTFVKPIKEILTKKHEG
ncbi:MAG TPA: UDP-N-acetylmuramate--L-alanine ligase [Cyclobacteriaceae bacterium]|nr:UDP-N-acetylmuramate--L-alanine ligase [Cyclobacteriaceae bacterium]